MSGGDLESIFESKVGKNGKVEKVPDVFQ